MKKNAAFLIFYFYQNCEFQRKFNANQRNRTAKNDQTLDTFHELIHNKQLRSGQVRSASYSNHILSLVADLPKWLTNTQPQVGLYVLNVSEFPFKINGNKRTGMFS